MKTLIISMLALVAASAFGQLTSATGSRLTNYSNWFAGFNVASDANYTTAPNPSAGTPAAFTDTNRSWGGWKANWGANDLGDPIISTPVEGQELKVEIVFLGETAGWWDDIGINRNGSLSLLADSVQTIGSGANRQFGDYIEFALDTNEWLDIFVTGTGVMGSNPGLTIGANGGLYYAFDQSMNQPASATQQSYWGQLSPITDDELVEFLFTILAFEDTRLGTGSDSDYNDVIIAYRAYYDFKQAPVPEPSTYGLLGAAALLLMIGSRRLRKAR